MSEIRFVLATECRWAGLPERMAVMPRDGEDLKNGRRMVLLP